MACRAQLYQWIGSYVQMGLVIFSVSPHFLHTTLITNTKLACLSWRLSWKIELLFRTQLVGHVLNPHIVFTAVLFIPHKYKLHRVLRCRDLYNLHRQQRDGPREARGQFGST